MDIAIDSDTPHAAPHDEPRRLRIVGVGASAGGLEAIERFFDHMPADSGLAFVVLQHLSPDHKSLMVEILSKRTAMPVKQVEDGTAIDVNTIYLLPPKKSMVIKGERLHLNEKVVGEISLPIDMFFRSLADDLGDRAIAVVLSGTGTDGMRGVQAIKEAGGMVMVQDPASAKFDGMPKAASGTGLVDYLLPPEEMPAELLRFIGHLARASVRSLAPGDDGDNNSLGTIFKLLRDKTTVDFTFYKPTTVLRRIERRMSIHQISKLDDYVHFARETPQEVSSLYKELLISVTKFFRDPEAYEILTKKVIPQIIEDTQSDETIRVWVPGCATGEEAYSIAMAFIEALEGARRSIDIKVFATDIDKDAIEFASAGIYPESVAGDLSLERISRFFVQDGDSFHVTRPLRQRVIFATHNVIKDPPFTRTDLISCRNLLIYLQPVLQQKVLSLFSFGLKPDRFLMLGTSETVGDMAEAFRPIDTKWKIYQGLGAVRRRLNDILSVVPARTVGRQTVRHGGQLTEEQIALDYALHALVDEFAPTALLVDDQLRLINVFGDASGYLKVPSGTASLNLLSMLSRRMSSVLSMAAHKALRSEKDVWYRGIPIGGDGPDANLEVSLRIRHFAEPKSGRRFLLIMFEDAKTSLATRGEMDHGLDVSAQAEQRITDLQQELQYTKENLQATIEELETSNEELQATNEEMLATNEELQSTNEELRSVNEELNTVNSEYQAKILELTELNADMDNLLASTNIGKVILDEHLCIRKFTPPVTSQINVMPRDIGRPIEHISSNLLNDHFLEDLQDVLRSGQATEKTVQSRDARVYQQRIMPYIAEPRQVKGLVVTFVDVTPMR
ncbi:MAG: chemotaxis protein CheB, partial [Myxococcales bacterium]